MELPLTEQQELLKSDCNEYGIIFNFKDAKGQIKTGIVRKGQYKEGIFLNGYVPNYRRMTRRERRSL